MFEFYTGSLTFVHKCRDAGDGKFLFVAFTLAMNDDCLWGSIAQ